MYQKLIIATSAILLASSAYAGDYHKHGTVNTNAAVPHYDLDVKANAYKSSRTNNVTTMERQAAKTRSGMHQSNDNVPHYNVDMDVDVKRKGYDGSNYIGFRGDTGIDGRYCNSFLDKRRGRC